MFLGGFPEYHADEWAIEYTRWFRETYGREPDPRNDHFLEGFVDRPEIPDDYFKENVLIDDLIFYRPHIYNEEDQDKMYMIWVEIDTLDTTTECPPEELEYC